MQANQAIGHPPHQTAFAHTYCEGFRNRTVTSLPRKELTMVGHLSPAQRGRSMKGLKATFRLSRNEVFTGQSGIFWSAPEKVRKSVAWALSIPQREMRQTIANLNQGNLVWNGVRRPEGEALTLYHSSSNQ
ncbi:uncharacterized protein LOC113914070 [Zalophus californianus]|uniref:Uncharacterized protein LOC113914070 n=1 Tax=Zalophus californianus TaxID=9704 RepID=A0A6J2BWU0_ZALCA|nr:uncharacterized protein LOC113914070 [Zalophus californianus]